ncbi:serine/threonine protein kinase [Candidatus Bathyarchaeota archaeon]|nr:serine/threonine protein kinase [Candidatus Bathyarchaeota archaeon]
MSEVVALGDLPGSPAGLLFSFPRYDEGVVEERLTELRGLGVEAVELGGRHLVGTVPVLGKGHVGIVVAARMGGERVALKVRRLDASRPSLEGEASYLGVANDAGVGPRLLASSVNFLVMELVEGDYLVDWVAGLEVSDAPRLRAVLREALEAARRLDVAGLDHGELSRADRHLIMSGGVPRMLDFESSSVNRRCRNVTSLAQFLFFNRGMAGRIGMVISIPGRDELLEALRGYRREPSDEGFHSLLGVCGLTE